MLCHVALPLFYLVPPVVLFIWLATPPFFFQESFLSQKVLPNLFLGIGHSVFIIPITVIPFHSVQIFYNTYKRKRTSSKILFFL